MYSVCVPIAKCVYNMREGRGVWSTVQCVYMYMWYKEGHGIIKQVRSVLIHIKMLNVHVYLASSVR